MKLFMNKEVGLENIVLSRSCISCLLKINWFCSHDFYCFWGLRKFLFKHFYFTFESYWTIVLASRCWVNIKYIFTYFLAALQNWYLFSPANTLYSYFMLVWSPMGEEFSTSIWDLSTQYHEKKPTIAVPDQRHT